MKTHFDVKTSLLTWKLKFELGNIDVYFEMIICFQHDCSLLKSEVSESIVMFPNSDIFKLIRMFPSENLFQSSQWCFRFNNVSNRCFQVHQKI